MLKPAAPPLPARNARIADCRHGRFLYFPQDIFIGRALETYGEYVEAEIALLLSLVTEGSVVVEVGSNIGADTVPLAKAVGDAGRVFAFEPQRIVFQLLAGNLALNGCWNVVAERAALGAERGLRFVPPVDYEQAGNFGGIALKADAGEPVTMLRLDDYGLARCDLLKIDVEGMEAEVLEGAKETIARHRPVIYTENDRDALAPALIAKLKGWGYDCRWHIASMFNPENFRGRADNVFPNLASFNMLCLPAERGLQSALPRADNGGALA